MSVLSRHCRPPRTDAVHSMCPLCRRDVSAGENAEEALAATGEIETASHFLSSCPAPGLSSLRLELCARLKRVLQTWEEQERIEAAAAWKGPLAAPRVEAATLAERQRAAAVKSGARCIGAIVDSMQLQLTRSSSRVVEGGNAAPESAAAAAAAVIVSADATRRQWTELLLGRSSDPLSGLAWSAPLLRLLDRHCHNFLLLAWRTRAELLGGVPTLLPAGRGIERKPYRRMKSIGLRPQ